MHGNYTIVEAGVMQTVSQLAEMRDYVNLNPSVAIVF